MEPHSDFWQRQESDLLSPSWDFELHWKLCTTQCRDTPEDCAFGHKLYPILQEVKRGGNELPISNAVSALDVCVYRELHCPFIKVLSCYTAVLVPLAYAHWKGQLIHTSWMSYYHPNGKWEDTTNNYTEFLPWHLKPRSSGDLNSSWTLYVVGEKKQKKPHLNRQ